MARGIELGERSEFGIGARVTIRRKNTREAYSRGADVSRAELHAMNVLIEAHRPRADVAVHEVPRDYAGGKELHFVAGSYRGQIILKALQIHDGICRHLRTVAVGKQRLAVDGVDGRELHRSRDVRKRDWSVGQSRDYRRKHERKCARDEIV